MSAKRSDRTTGLLGGGGGSPATGSRSLLEPGTILNERYRIERELGRGGVGVVYLARDQRLHNLPVVVKVLLERFGDNEDRAWFEKKFKDEIRALAQIDHPGVVRALDVGELPDGRSFLVMQYVSGVDLRSLIRPTGLELTRIATLIRQIGHALSAAHQKGVLHRDLKPENIMMQTVGSEEFVKLIDFGMATVLETSGSVKTTIVAGTVQYMAPEQMQGRPCMQSDIFAMGVIAYETVTGRLPFKPRTPYELVELQRAGVRREPRDLRPELSEAAQSAILKALAFDPGKRYQSASEFGDRLADTLNGDAQREPRSGWESQRNGVQLAHVLLAEVDGYSRMTVEEQTRSLEELQAVVRRTREFQQANSAGELISQVATRGMALVFFGPDPLVAVRCAVEIADALRTSDNLKVRIGMHTGPVKVIPDINDRPNVSGDGVDTADRVMRCGESGQILLSRTVADVLRHLSEWSPHLKDLGERRIDGGQRVRVFSLVKFENAHSASRGVVAFSNRWTRIPKTLIAALMIVLLLVVLAVIARRPAGSPIPEVLPQRTLTYSVIARKDPRRYPGAKPLAAPDGMIFEAGDRVRLNVSSNGDGQLYVISEDRVQVNGQPPLTLLFPSATNNGGSADVKANQPVHIPASSVNPDQSWLEFKKNEGGEKLWLVWSAQGVTELEAVKGRANPREQGAIAEPGLVKSITEYLMAHATPTPDIRRDEGTNETTFSNRGESVVGLVTLERRRSKP